jgi:hypothetical protein
MQACRRVAAATLQACPARQNPPFNSIDYEPDCVEILIDQPAERKKTMQKPASVTVFGILNIVFAVFGIIGMFASVFLLFPQANANNPVIQIIHDSPAYAAWLKLSIALGAVVCVVLLAAGIGLLRLRPWARMASIIYAIYAILMGLVGMVVNYYFLVQPMLAQAQQKQGAEAAGAIGGAIGGCIGGCFGLIYPILLLIFMTRANVVAAFRPTSGQPADGQQ